MNGWKGKRGCGGKDVECEEGISIQLLELESCCSTELRTADGAVQNPAAPRPEVPPQEGASEDAPLHRR